ncbi:MAG: winged helix-turn-helix transcriptional regulator [Tissierellia bacterium]|nr:winged helix-turn-helix transcriptional regulator [Tissierellia bacterium]
MKFKFYPRESRIYDFLKFPRLIYFDKNKNETDDNFEEFVITSYVEFVKEAEEKLAPYRKEIQKFYAGHFYHEYDFIDLVSRTHTIFNYEDEKEYLDMLLTLEDSEIIKSIVHSIIAINEEGHSYSDVAMERVEKISSNKEDLISFIKDLPIEAASKWNLFLIIEEPVDHVKNYVDLMYKILPIFESIYSSYEAEVKEYGEKLVGFLNEKGPQGLEDITYSIVKPDVVDYGETNIIISIVFSYAISIMSSVKISYVAWGLRMEEAFKYMKEINENKTNERIQVFKNLGDKTRYEVAKLIASGENSTKEIANALGVSSATISYHINNLLTSKIIKLDKVDNKHFHVVDYGFLEEVISGFMEDLKFPKND